jgi:tetratricopeptide (TPR) repeat protein
MRALLATRRAESRVCLMFVHAPEGLGRFSVASEFFYDDPEAFAGVWIEIAARQADGSLTSQGDMLAQALRGLGLPDAEQPASDAARAEAFQRLSAGRNFLLFIRDVASAVQVAALIPDAAPQAAVLVTTRTLLRDLYSLDFADIALHKLPEKESRELMAKGLGPTADKIDPDTLRELADLCDGFPLLIRVLSAQIVGRARTAPRFLVDVRNSVIVLLSMDVSQRMAKSLDLSYDTLLRDLQRAYRTVSLIPGSSFSSAAAAAAMNTDLDQAERLLDELVDANLLVFDESERYSFHGIIRADATLRAREIDGPEGCSAAVGRVVIWYLDEAVPRDAALSDRWRVGPVFAEYTRSGREPIARDDANAWFEAEWRTLVACVAAAQTVALHDGAWQLCIAAFKFLHQHGHYDAWLDSHSLALTSAEMSGNTAAIMQITSQRGAARLAVGSLDLARTDFLRSLDAAVAAKNPLGEQSAQEWLGKVEAAEGDVDAALRAYDLSQAVIDRAGDAIPPLQRVRMAALLSLQRARAFLIRQSWDDASASITGAVDYFGPQSKERENRAKSLLVLGQARFGAGDVAGAVVHFADAAGLFARDHIRRAEAGARLWLGDAHSGLGDTTSAVGAYQRSLELFSGLGDPTGDVVQGRIDALRQRD